ncbi:5-(carboxyamino)imidazole ribonucleotide synthase [Carnobacterium gallinarum]|uniref:5-(carboxyamino)imidazole ribonucleotide synthase n=1 Tax=Carnobacterium gallinarum TaxID=2749 RepID=UPI00054F287A|nr:5-(carboxyamino)imidazole ribonucleotide synthase [Carnobacterium gallinarum]
MMNLSNLIIPGKTIGIIGGGQLGRMMTLAAKKMGYVVGVLDPERNCPTAQVADWHITAKYNDVEALRELALRSDVVTYEFENVDVDAITKIEHLVHLPQGSELLSITQDRLLEKAYLEENNINIAPYATIIELQDIADSIDSIGFPCVLKTIRGGYDGKGQIVLYGEEDISKCELLLKTGICVLEAWIPFERECSVMVARNEAGEISVMPVAENLHRNNILHETIVPARIDEEITEEVQLVATRIAEKLNLVGVLGIEMFLTSSGSLYVNELAPRPHNSGHYSIEACSFSQFDLHIRGICGWPLPEVKLLSKAVMVNILGEQIEESVFQILLKPDWHFHYYGKDMPKLGRKMGHITILTENIERTLETIENTGIWE